eukprot:sb/3474152/
MNSKEFQGLLNMEKTVMQMIEYARASLQEISHERDGHIDVPKVKMDAQYFVKQVQQINDKLIQAINYLGDASTTLPHTGNVYNCEKDFHMAYEQCVLMINRIGEIQEKTKPRVYKRETDVVESPVVKEDTVIPDDSTEMLS